MTAASIDEEKFRGEIRKFLKTVGITSQVEIEQAVRRALADGSLVTSQPLHAVMVLEVPALGLRHEIDHELVMD